ncbi:MAG: hypothetical protein OXU98_03870 [Gammaproteobacteria bacterium]|nr:hypothetical protein [Gammaproteobacteria bacterium]
MQKKNPVPGMARGFSEYTPCVILPETLKRAAWISVLQENLETCNTNFHIARNG